MTYNVPVRNLQGGSVEEIGASGTILVRSGGALILEAGAFFSNGGTVGRMTGGTVGFASGVGTFATGLTRVVSASIQPISGDPPGLGSFTTSVIDLTLSGAGSVIFRAGAGTLPYAAGGTAAWLAFGS